jgi:hypothetical protein
LGRTFTSRITVTSRLTSRTASCDVTIGFPQLDPGSTSPGRLIPPEWTFGPSDESERAKESDTIDWGQVLYRGTKGCAVVFRCRFYTTLTASDFEEFDFLTENIIYGDWWKHFTSWAGIVASQDLVGLPWWGERGPDWEAWTSDARGQRELLTRDFYNPSNLSSRILQLHELEACVTAIGDQPPAEWLFIRDARSHLNAFEFRRAVIDAATAAELAMTALIDKFLDDASVLEPVRKALARSSTNLGGKKEVLNLLWPGLLPSSVQNDLINKRNGASHRGEEYGDDETRAAIDIATAIVESAYPLASLLPTLGGPAPQGHDL